MNLPKISENLIASPVHLIRHKTFQADAGRGTTEGGGSMVEELPGGVTSFIKKTIESSLHLHHGRRASTESSSSQLSGIDRGVPPPLGRKKSLGYSELSLPSLYRGQSISSLEAYGAKEGILRGPRRLLRLCIFALVVPVLLVTIPMYARLVLYPPGEYPMAPTDQRLIHGQVSSIWCQSQSFHMNGSFNAYMLPNIPGVKLERRRYTMLQRLRLSDDVKEYWGFNLLKGSTVTLSSCSRWEGGQVLILRGLNNLHRCAWIGEEDSSEEPEELMWEDPTPTPNPMEESPRQEPDSSNSTQQGLVSQESTQSKHQSQERMKNMANLIQEVVRISKNKKEILGLLYKQSRHYSQEESSVSIELDPDEPFPAETDSAETDPAEKNPVEADPIQSDAAESQPSALSVETPPVKEALQRKLKKGRKKGNKDKRKGNKRRLENVRQRRDAIQEEAEEDEEEDGAFEVDDEDKRLPFSYVEGKPLPEGLQVEQHKPWAGRKLRPSGMADDRGTFDQRTPNDYSMEEHRSSYSSSEEALASCEGVLLALPLVPDRRCSSFRRTISNTITYDIPVTGTYYFVFSSDNEITTNKVLFNLTMDKVIYDVDPSHDLCLNTTDCSLPIDFWSSDQAVVEVDGVPHWQEAYQLNTSCDPRVAVYLTFVLLVPLLILFCALK